MEEIIKIVLIAGWLMVAIYALVKLVRRIFKF